MIPTIVIIVLSAILVFAFLKITIKVVSGNEVLVVTGLGATKKIQTKKKVERNGAVVTESDISYVPRVVIAGASVVIPFIQKYRVFDICVEKAEQKGDTIKTKTGVEVDVDWGISYAPNADTIDTLQPCIRQFLDKDKKEIEEIIKNAVAGGMRAVISTMTPAEVMIGKDKLDDAVQKNINGQMAELGYKVQLYIQEVRDSHDSTYYKDIAALDRETTRQNAAQIKADVDKAIRERQAETERDAQGAEIAADVAMAEKSRDAMIRKAEFKAETDRAQADAEIAGRLQTTERQRELAEREGNVNVMIQEQANLAAKKKQEVMVTEAETKKREAVIRAEAEARAKEIDAEARANVVTAEATGKANARKCEAEATAASIQIQAEAEAEKIRMTGEAEAAAILAKGEAEAAAQEAIGKAQAEAERALADARAANDRVNFEIQKLEIERDTKIQIATNVATVMANIGENAVFYDFGGSKDGNSQDILTRVMSGIPEIFKKASLTNEALNGEPIDATIAKLISAAKGNIPENTESDNSV